MPTLDDRPSQKPTLYKTYLHKAIHHHGDLASVAGHFPDVASASGLRAIPDDRYLAEMAACIFRSGFVWRVVTQKWEGFEAVFNGFNPLWVASRSPEQIEEMACDTRIIRHLRKVKAVQDNALFVLDLAREHGSVGNFLAAWPEDDIIGLWAYLKKHGSRLGGHSGAYFLRFMGKDTFILSRDVCTALRSEGVIDTDSPSAKRDLLKVQQAFNDMRRESGYPYAALSRLLALSLGPR